MGFKGNGKWGLIKIGDMGRDYDGRQLQGSGANIERGKRGRCESKGV